MKNNRVVFKEDQRRAVFTSPDFHAKLKALAFYRRASLQNVVNEALESFLTRGAASKDLASFEKSEPRVFKRFVNHHAA